MLLHGDCPYLGHGARPLWPDFALALLEHPPRCTPHGGRGRTTKERYGVNGTLSQLKTILHSTRNNVERFEQSIPTSVSAASDLHREREHELDVHQHTLPYINYMLENVSIFQSAFHTSSYRPLLSLSSTTLKPHQFCSYATMAVKINKISVHKIRPSNSRIDFGAEIRGADLENLSGKSVSF